MEAGAEQRPAGGGRRGPQACEGVDRVGDRATRTRAELDLCRVCIVAGGLRVDAHRFENVVRHRRERVRRRVDQEQLLLDADGELRAERERHRPSSADAAAIRPSTSAAARPLEYPPVEMPPTSQPAA